MDITSVNDVIYDVYEVISSVMNGAVSVFQPVAAVVKPPWWQELIEEPLFQDVVQVTFFSLINLIIWVPFLLRFAFKKLNTFTDGVTSDIPGNMHAFDDSLISAFRTLPEPNNFNVVYTNLDLSKDVVITGKVPSGTRFSSISVYPAFGTKGSPPSSNVPVSIDLSDITREDGSFELEVVSENCREPSASTSRAHAGTSAEGSESASGVETPLHDGFGASQSCQSTPARGDIQGSGRLSSGKWKRGYMAMRNYLVPPGTRVVPPTVEEMRTGRLLRRADAQIAGALAYHNVRAAQVMGVFGMCWVLIRFLAIYVLLSFAFDNLDVDPLLARMLLLPRNIILPNLPSLGRVTRNYAIGWMGAYLMRVILFFCGRMGLKRWMKSLKVGKNMLEYVSIEDGARVSQPSALHHYYVSILELTKKDIELHVDVWYRPDLVKYWSLIVYDRVGMPLGNYASDQMMLPTSILAASSSVDSISPEPSAMKRSGLPSSSSETGRRHATIILADLKHRKPESLSTDPSRIYVDVSDIAACGYVILRTVGGLPDQVRSCLYHCTDGSPAQLPHFAEVVRPKTD